MRLIREPHLRLPLILASLLLLAACGASTTAQGGGVTPSASLNGCPTQLIPVDPFGKPDLILTQQSDPGTFVKSVTVTQGQSLEIRLPAHISWRLTASDPAQTLAMAQPAGWYNSQLLACIWRFSAVSPGEANLDFSGGLVCAPGSACPAIAAVAQYHITVA
jgi:hypothetical protein